MLLKNVLKDGMNLRLARVAPVQPLGEFSIRRELQSLF